MIAKAIKSKDGKGTGGSGFRGLIDYITGKADAVQTENLVGPVTAAAAQMRVTANVNERVQKPAYHVVATWHEHETPTDGQMFEAGRRMLHHLGAADHQVVMAVHRDRDHCHIHVVVNRVNPATNTAFSLSNDYLKLEKAAREIEAEQGWAQDRGRFDAEITEHVDKPEIHLRPKPQHHWDEVKEKRARGRRQGTREEHQREKRTGERPLKEALLADGMKERVTAALDNNAWRDVHRDLAALGLDYRPHGSGARLYVRGGADDFMPSSHMGKAYSHKKMETRLGDFQEAPTHEEYPIDRHEPDITVAPSWSGEATNSPTTSKAQRYKASLISRTYRGIWLNDKVVANIRHIDIDSETPRVTFRDGMEVCDHGDEVTATNVEDADMAAESLITMSHAKGWTSIKLTGRRDIVLAATRKAAARGMDVDNADQEMREIIRDVQQQQPSEPDTGQAGQAPDTFEAERAAAAEQSAMNADQRAAHRDARQNIDDTVDQQRQEARPLYREGDRTIRQAARGAINERAERQRARVDQQHPKPRQRVHYPDYHEHAQQQRARGDQRASRDLQERKLRHSRRDQEDELEQIKRLDLRAVAEMHGYSIDDTASRDAGRGQWVMRRGNNTIKLREPDADGARDWTFVNNKSGDRGGVIQFYQAETGANLGQVRRDLRPLIGREPSLETAQYDKTPKPSAGPTDHTAVRQQWERARILGSASPAYAQERGISMETLQRFPEEIKVSERGALLFAHRDANRNIKGFEVKGPGWTGFAKGGSKEACTLGDPTQASRVVVTESAIDALSKAQIEERDDTVYISTGGGMSQKTVDRICDLADTRHVELGFDADAAGDQLAQRLHTALEGAHTASVSRVVPTQGKDWNEDLQHLLKAEQEQQRQADADADSQGMSM